MSFWILLNTAVTVVQVAASVSQFYTDRATRRAASAQERAYESATRVAENINRGKCVLERTVHVPATGFNASPAFLSLFAASAITGSILLAKTNSTLDKLNDQVEEIKNELQIQTTASIAGWKDTGYGSFIYKFLKTEIDAHGGTASVGNHAFYVYNPTTIADVQFREEVEKNPLPSSFAGYGSDIEAIFCLMWANRQTLRATMSKEQADAVVFHLLIPAKGVLAIIEPVAIHESIGKLILKGHTNDDSCYVRLNLARLPSDVTLDGICNLNTARADFESRELWEKRAKAGFAGWGGCCVGVFATGALFPPAAPAFLLGYVACCAGTCVSAIKAASLRIQESKTRILGQPANFTLN
jgi:hypothetical protein